MFNSYLFLIIFFDWDERSGFLFCIFAYLSGRVPVDDVDPPEVLRGHGDVVVDVAADLLVVRRHGRGHVVGVEGAVGEAVHQLDDLAVLDAVQRLLHGQVLAVWSLDDPPVVDILEGVAGHLLLVRGPSPVGISVGNNTVTFILLRSIGTIERKR